MHDALPLAPQRFLEKIAPGADCWMWQGVRIPGGYGQFWWRGRMVNAHIMAVRFSGREIGVDAIVRHSCDNPPCCNPIHLLVGTQADNQADMVSKSRQAFGERHGRAILSEQQVREILLCRETAAEAASRYGVSHWAINDIRQGRSWRHLSR